MGSQTGTIFRVTTFGESHGAGLGAIVEGCPPGIAIDLTALQADLDRRRPGQSRLTTTRAEKDQVQVLSGVFDGHTTGTPIGLLFLNHDARSRNYDSVKNLFRPGHADLTYHARYGRRDYRGGGRASARETAARVAAAGIARQFLTQRFGIEVVGWVATVGDIVANVDAARVSRADVEANPARCPDPEAADAMYACIDAARKDGDTVGGVAACVARGVPPGWGDPVFDKLDADLAKACLSLPACKGFEIGSGFAGTRLRGSTHNDSLVPTPNGIGSATNRAGGVLGGISSGAPVLIRAAFKPVSTHFKLQRTVNVQGEAVDFKNEGRHDPCVLPRAVPLVEAAMLLTLADHALRTQAIRFD